MQLPVEMPLAGDHVHRAFAGLLARFMPFDLVIDEETADGQEARVSKTSVAGSWGAVAGTLRYFADRFGTPRASIEGTSIPMALVRKYATHGDAEMRYDADRRNAALTLRRRTEYFGFELEREIEVVEEPFTPEVAPIARRTLAEAMARGEARHIAARKNREAIERVREVYRRSGGTTAKLGFPELAAIYESKLGAVSSVEEFMRTPLRIDADSLVPAEEQERWLSLPDAVMIRDREVPIEYDVEETDGGKLGVARLVLSEKMARTLTESELPALDRPLRFVVPRGQRGAARSASLDDLQELLEQPWTQDEIARLERERGREREDRKREFGMRKAKGELRRGRAEGRGRPSGDGARGDRGRSGGGRDGNEGGRSGGRGGRHGEGGGGGGKRGGRGRPDANPRRRGGR
jgi:hypothetical protein